MVVHDASVMPTMDIAATENTFLKKTSYVIVDNHVKELPQTVTNSNNKLQDISGMEDTEKKAHRKGKKLKKAEKSLLCNSDKSSTTLVLSEDLDELRTMYMKCKEIVQKIERKYGHILGLEDEDNTGECRKRRIVDYSDLCMCEKKRKIVFDDEGKQSTVEMISDSHICVDKLKDTPRIAQNHSINIEVEYQDVEIGLPNDLQELANMLHDPSIQMTLRNKIIEKIRLLKQEYSYELRFNRHILIEKSKSNCDEVFDFKGANLSIIPGYP